MVSYFDCQSLSSACIRYSVILIQDLHGYFRFAPQLKPFRSFRNHTETGSAQNIEPTASHTTQRPTEALISTPNRPTSDIIPKKPFVASASSDNLVQDNDSASAFVASASSENLVQGNDSASAFVASASYENLVHDNDSASAFLASVSSENLVQDNDAASSGVDEYATMEESNGEY